MSNLSLQLGNRHNLGTLGVEYGLQLDVCGQLSSLLVEEFLDEQFASAEKETTVASAEEKAKFARFMAEYKKCLAVEKLATETL